ncbi:MAG: DUF2911 domain-containing protein [Ferruginibacter sp.]
MQFFPGNYLKYAFLCFIIAACTRQNNTQDKSISLDSLPAIDKNAFSSGDQSPMDMSYFPPGFPLQKMSGKDSVTTPSARIIYSRPHKKGRPIFGDSEQSLCRYGKEWRLGANEATEIEFFKDATIAGTKLPKGRYVLYCIPYADRWTVVFNKNLHTWGLHMDPKQDIFKTDIPTIRLSPALEDFTIVFLPATNGTDMLMAWDTVKTLLPISFSE